MRLLNFAALAILVVAGRRLLVAWAQKSTITTLGRASLTVFSVHLLVCLAVLAAVGDAVQPHVGLTDTMLVVGTLVTLYAVARAMLEGGEALRMRWAALRAEVSARVAR